MGAPVPKGRFAPSPTGRMHAGNIYSALLTWLLVKSRGGRILLRIEDLDRERSKAEYATLIQKDLEALGLAWDEGPVYQSDREEAYKEAFSELERSGRVYPCFCTRAQIKAAREIASAPHGPAASYYPGTCRDLSEIERERSIQAAEAQGCGFSSRVATDLREIAFDDLLQGEQAARLDPSKDDFIIRRSDGLFAYQLAVVVDDAEQGVNLVSRGIDLLPSTPRQIYLHQLLGNPRPAYAHFPLFVNSDGKRLAKRDKPAAFDALMRAYGSPEAIIGHIAYIGGIVDEDGMSAAPSELLPLFDENALAENVRGRISIPFR